MRLVNIHTNPISPISSMRVIIVVIVVIIWIVVVIVNIIVLKILIYVSLQQHPQIIPSHVGMCMVGSIVSTRGIYIYIYM